MWCKAETEDAEHMSITKSLPTCEGSHHMASQEHCFLQLCFQASRACACSQQYVCRYRPAQASGSHAAALLQINEQQTCT